MYLQGRRNLQYATANPQPHDAAATCVDGGSWTLSKVTDALYAGNSSIHKCLCTRAIVHISIYIYRYIILYIWIHVQGTPKICFVNIYVVYGFLMLIWFWFRGLTGDLDPVSTRNTESWSEIRPELTTNIDDIIDGQHISRSGIAFGYRNKLQNKHLMIMVSIFWCVNAVMLTTFCCYLPCWSHAVKCYW